MSDIFSNTKFNTEGELIVVFFEQCNLSCKFCPQDHKSIVGMDTVLEKIPAIKNSLDMLIKRGKKSVSINLMGGELLEDRISDEIFDDYEKIILQIREYTKQINLTVDINIITNLVFSKVDRVVNFLDRVKIPIAISYDPAGRFNSKNFKIFKNNVQYFKKYITQVGVVITNPTIEKFLKNDVPFFNYLYENFIIVFDHYGPESPGYKGVPNLLGIKIREISSIKPLFPTDVTLREFYKYMFEVWPKCYPFCELNSKKSRPMTCMSTITITPESNITSCEKYSTENKQEKTKIIFGEIDKWKEKWFKDYDCFSCEHMQRCSLGCYSNHLRSGRTQEICWLKEVYNYVDKNEK